MYSTLVVLLSIMYIQMLFVHRAGALTLEEVEEDYGEDVEFLLAKLKKIEEDKDVCLCTGHDTGKGCVHR